MTRQISLLHVLLLALTLAGFQAFGLAHAAEHGFEEHTHSFVTYVVSPCAGSDRHHDNDDDDGFEIDCELDIIASEDDEAITPKGVSSHLSYGRHGTQGWGSNAIPLLARKGPSQPARGPPSAL